MFIVKAQWRIQLFGALVVDKPTGERIPLTGKKAGELLAYLALHPDQAHPRERLISLLWGDTDVSNARTRLRQEVLKLRARFDSEAEPSPLLHIVQNELQINPEARIDAVGFLAACSEARKEQDPERKRDLVAAACDLYRADLLAEYDSLWIAAERARFSQVYEQLLQDHAEFCRLRRDYAAAEESLQRLVMHSSRSEEGHIALMRLYAEQGQPTRVQRQYQALEQALRATSVVAPSADMRRLAETLRAEAAQRAAAGPLPPISDHPGGDGRPSVSSPEAAREQTVLSAPDSPFGPQSPPLLAPNATSNGHTYPPGTPRRDAEAPAASSDALSEARASALTALIESPPIERFSMRATTSKRRLARQWRSVWTAPAAVSILGLIWLVDVRAGSHSRPPVSTRAILPPRPAMTDEAAGKALVGVWDYVEKWQIGSIAHGTWTITRPPDKNGNVELYCVARINHEERVGKSTLVWHWSGKDRQLTRTGEESTRWKLCLDKIGNHWHFSGWNYLFNPVTLQYVQHNSIELTKQDVEPPDDNSITEAATSLPVR
jgi:DNA-binding SARP family transcriptional activator